MLNLQVAEIRISLPQVVPYAQSLPWVQEQS